MRKSASIFFKNLKNEYMSQFVIHVTNRHLARYDIAVDSLQSAFLYLTGTFVTRTCFVSRRTVLHY